MDFKWNTYDIVFCQVLIILGFLLVWAFNNANINWVFDIANENWAFDILLIRIGHLKYCQALVALGF